MDRDEDLWYISGTSLLDNLKNSAREDIRQLHEQVLRKNTFYRYTFGLPLKEMNTMVNTGQGQMIVHQAAARLQMGAIHRAFGEVPFRMTKVTHIVKLLASMIVFSLGETHHCIRWTGCPEVLFVCRSIE